jgi:Holliday junction resolvasome RuvABC DNA-binding subunit
MHHLSLAHQTNEEMMFEVKQSITELEDKLEIKIEHFAYPYGSLKDANQREFEFLKKLGFRTATLNHAGNVFLSSKNSSEKLPRYPLGNNATAEIITYYLNGIRHFAVNGWKKNIT